MWVDLDRSMKNMKIKHRIVHVYKQGHKPICGIYAFLNGVFYNNVSMPPSKSKIDELAKILWKEALNSEYSTVGEFFSSDKLIQFLDSISHNDELTREMHSCGINNFKVEKEITFSETKKKKLIHEIEEKLKSIKNDEFYLIPINSSPAKGKNENIMHWICYKRDRKGRLTIFDSNPTISSRLISLIYRKQVPEGKALKNSGIRFYRNIHTIEQLAEVYENMYNRESEYEKVHGGQHTSFSFYSWAPKLRKIKKMEGKVGKDSGILKDYWSRLYEIKESGKEEKSYKYEFNKNEFKIIPVKIMTKETEFDDQHRIKGALYPYDNKKRENCEPQWTKLEAALSDKNITNVAITSSYDTGKTSFLKSFFKEEYKKNKSFFKRRSSKERYKFVTIPTFSEKESNINEENLEKNVINQLLFSEDQKDFPDSRIDRIRAYSIWWIISIWAILWILGGLIFSLTPIASTFWNDGAWRKRIILGMVLIISLWLIYHIVHNSYRLSWNAKASLGPVELSGADNKGNIKQSDQNLFILYGDEIKYYFLKSKVEFVIFEDMDRFNNIDIFQKLRELNKNINESELLRKKKKKVVFIYTLSDAIFKDENEQENNPNDEEDKKDKGLINENKAAESKAKFFDYVISLMPFNNLNSSEQVFKDEIRNYPEVEKLHISERILLGINFYISDRREIACIAADMDTYLRNLNRIQGKLESDLKLESNFGNKLFAAMIYKNVYPQDFDNLSKGKSNLGYFLQNLDILKESIDDLFMKGNFNRRDYDEDRNIANLLSIVWDNYTSVIDRNKKDQKLENALNYIKKSSVLRYLLAQNLIGGDFYEFISPTQFDTLSSPEQIMFLQHVLAQRQSDTDLEITDRNNLLIIISLLDATNADYSYVYSSSILEREIQLGDENKVSQIIEGVSEKYHEATEKEINNKEEFLNKVITWLYHHQSEIDDDSFILLGRALNGS